MAGLESAREAGRAAGVAAGSWVVDGNTSQETMRAILQGLEDGDPAVYDSLPSAPLSGEWADAPTPRDIVNEYSEEGDDEDAMCTAYEEGYAEGVEAEVARSCRAMLGEDAS